jgi:hypothetical protein
MILQQAGFSKVFTWAALSNHMLFSIQDLMPNLDNSTNDKVETIWGIPLRNDCLACQVGFTYKMW